MTEEIDVLYYKVGTPPVKISTPNDLKSFQKLVGGYIESISLGREIDVYLNEEGKLIPLLPNRILIQDSWLDIIFGDFLICSHNEDGEAVSLTDLQIDYALSCFTEKAV